MSRLSKWLSRFRRSDELVSPRNSTRNSTFHVSHIAIEEYRQAYEAGKREALAQLRIVAYGAGGNQQENRAQQANPSAMTATQYPVGTQYVSTGSYSNVPMDGNSVQMTGIPVPSQSVRATLVTTKPQSEWDS